MNVVYIAVFIVITAVSSLFAWIGPDEIRKSRMRNIEPAVDDGDDYFRFFSGGGGGILPLAAQISVRRTPHSESEADKNQGASVCADDGTTANRYTAENNTFEFILQ